MKCHLFLVPVLFAAVLFSHSANADLDKAMDDMCEKMKSCSTAEIKRQGLSEDMVTMMSAMFDGMCKSWMTPYADALGNAGLEEKAEACIDSVVKVSCPDLLQSEGRFRSDACDTFQQAVKQSGVDAESVSQ